jgi:hypothetical protein
VVSCSHLNSLKRIRFHTDMARTRSSQSVSAWCILHDILTTTSLSPSLLCCFWNRCGVFLLHLAHG